MTKLPSSDKVISVLLDYGFVFKKSKRHPSKIQNREKTVIVPAPRKQIPIGTLKSISKQSGIAYSEFINL
ncbi:MAG: type II toxin-antitoxin system HicA family toxin [Saprospiraceae bacterium]|nr:type II toxin-antitoxin system HicA family toxin [Saprospiraceae bacterium]